MVHINNYSVNKYFGHFWQQWQVTANSEQDAWDNAERRGHLSYQSVYKDEMDLDSPGYVVNLDEKKKKDKPISDKQYYEWMREAIEKGMICTKKEEYERATGLPFVDVW